MRRERVTMNEDVDRSFYTPVAFVIESQVENQNLFKKIMMLLYDHIRNASDED